jgi:lipopolysaccharide transport system ATP-binding protein
VALDGQVGDELYGRSGASTLRVEIDFESDPALPAPTAAVVLSSESGRILATQFSLSSGRPLTRDRQGRATAVFECDHLPFNKGRYRVGAYILCERGIHVYQWIDPVAHINLYRDTLDLGFFVWSGRWGP